MPAETDHLDDLLDFGGDLDPLAALDIDPTADPLSTTAIPDRRAIRRDARRRWAHGRRQDLLGDVLGDKPAPGETIHFIADGSTHTWNVVQWAIDQLGQADRLYFSTWTINANAVRELAEQWQAGRIGDVGCLTGLYFRQRETAVYCRLLDTIRRHGGRYRAFLNHSKIALLYHGEDHIVIEGSANMTDNPRAEQFAITNDRDLWAHYRDWFEETLARIPPETDLGTGPKRKKDKLAHPQTRAGFGVWAVTRDKHTRKRLFAAKLDPAADPDTDTIAEALTAVIQHWQPSLPAAAVVTCPPQGASAPGQYYAETLAQTVATRLDRRFHRLLKRAKPKTTHHPHAALAAAEDVRLTRRPPSFVLVIDDAITSGATMRASLAALRAKDAAAFGFAYAGC